MAKKAEVKPDASLFARTETPTPPQPSKRKATTKSSAAAIVAPDDFPDITKGNMIPRGAGYREGELAALQYIADVWGVNRNALMRVAVQYFIREYLAGNVRREDYFEVSEPRPVVKLKNK